MKKWITHTLLLSIVPVILFGTLMYMMGARIVQEEIHRSSMESLSQVRHQVEANMVNIEQMTSQLALQSNIIDVMNVPNGIKLGTVPKVNEVRDLLLRMKNVTDTIHSIYFYHMGQQVVISHDLVTYTHEARVFRDLSWLGHVESMVESSQSQMWVTPRQMVFLNDHSVQTLSHIRVLPMLSNHPKAAIVVNLLPDFLSRTMARFPLDSNGQLLVMNAEGQLIAQMPGGSSDRGRDESFLREMALVAPDSSASRQVDRHFLSMVQSPDSGWTYAIAVPSSVPRQQVERFGQTIILITVVLCLLSVYAGYFTHSNFQRSIRTILDRISPGKAAGGATTGGDAITEIGDQVNRLLEEVKEGQHRQTIHLPLLRTHYLHALIHGNALDISRLAHEVENSEIFPYDRYGVLLAQMDDSTTSSFRQERELFLFAVSNIGTELSKLQQPEEVPFRIETVITDRHTVLIVNYPSGEEAEGLPAQLADRLRSVVKQILKQTITIGVGTGVATAHALVYSYREAIQALHMNLANAYDEVLPYANMTLVAERLVQYPAAEEQDLLHALRTRDAEAAAGSLREFRSKLEMDLASLHMAKTFYLQLLVAVIRLVQEYEEDIVAVFGENPYESFFRMESIPQIDQWFRTRLLSTIVGYMDSVKRRTTDAMIRQTVELIHQRYVSDLSLQTVAEEMGISVSYLSKLFKEQLGETFIDYVTRIRLEHAQQLLVETDLTMQQIADAIGYTSVQQMFRVFKKRLGMTPGEYREKSAG
ncbi:helix-turn-helix domain-containing protein [Paenibacillus daejeonensis]|uniref:helix-turn-helix domain-containing protein n=1 Tax=Paenibacillus daejeonensis TaxID=135193 RepID=UPI0003674614|nr:helix-turn-helix domain-containing protein [Paenibacillus daejeonensis]